MVHEDPDQLGYWMGDSGYAEERPPTPYEVCCEILSPWEQGQIEHAANLAELGHHDHAATHRRLAGYGETPHIET